MPTAIEWCDETWNPLRGTGDSRWMCQKISPGCDNCYASRLNHRFGGPEYPVSFSPPVDPPQPNSWCVRLDERVRTQPYHWKRPRMIFVCSMTDLFGEWVPDEW